MTMVPLSGCRVLDLGIITAGAATAACLADFGTEVIKIESPTYRDPFRRWLSDKPSDANDDLPPSSAAVTERGQASPTPRPSPHHSDHARPEPESARRTGLSCPPYRHACARDAADPLACP